MVRPCHELFPLIMVAVNLAVVGATLHRGGTRPTVGLASKRCPPYHLCFVPATASAASARCGTREDEPSTTLRHCSGIASQPTRGRSVATGAGWLWARGSSWRRPIVSCNRHPINTSTGSQSRSSRVASGETPEDGTVTTGTVVGGGHWHAGGSSNIDHAARLNGDAAPSVRKAGERRR